MKNCFWIVMTGLIAISYLPCAAQVSSEFVNATFQDVLLRVERRDKESDAIVSVKAKADSPLPSGNLHFSIERTTWNANAVIVTLSKNSTTKKGGREEFEKYVLMIDTAIEKELKNQERLKQAAAEYEKKIREERTKRINDLTNGKLKYGMSPEEVKTVKGKPQEVGPPPAAAASFTWIYPDVILDFASGRLRDAVKRGK